MSDESQLLRQVLGRGIVTPQEAQALNDRYLRLLARENAWNATAAGNAEHVAIGIIAKMDNDLAKLAEIKKHAMVAPGAPEESLQSMISWHELAIPQMEERMAKRIAPSAGAESARRKELHDYLLGRGVIGLRHFTRRENLPSILEHGLMPRNAMIGVGLKHVANDSLRLDGSDGVCLSVSFPNYKLFWNFRAPETEPLDWVVIDLSPKVVQRKLCVFNARNAAHNSMSKQTIEERTRMSALEEMFYDQALRIRLGLPDDCTTDPQAEIVVPERIEPEMIDNVLFNLPVVPHNKKVLNDYSMEFGTAWQGKFMPVPEMFKPRRDYEYWKKGGG